MKRIIFILYVINLFVLCGCSKDTNMPTETATEYTIEETTVEPTIAIQQIQIEDKEKLNSDYKIKNDAAENVQLENSFNDIIEVTGTNTIEKEK